jgi:hypothetical protein
MTARKWQLVEGRVFKLSKVFNNCIDALNHVRILNRDHHAVLIKSSDGRWATYWRSRDEYECDSESVIDYKVQHGKT